MSRRTHQDGPDGSESVELHAFHGDGSSQLYHRFHDSTQSTARYSDFSLLRPTSSSEDRAESLLSDGQSTEATFPQSHGVSNEITDDAEVPMVRASRKRRYRFKSWKIGVASAAIMTTAVFVTNFAVALWGYLRFDFVDGVGTALDGSCDKVADWNFGLHIVINILSSAMLGASNYAMQCVTAPTRRECDLAHARGRWLDIGIPSIRNLFHISWQRKILWVLLALSSTPIHLLYNSSVFKTLDANAYFAAHVSERLLQSDVNSTAKYEAQLNATDLRKLRNQSKPLWDWGAPEVHNEYMTHMALYERLSAEDCIKAYVTPFLTGHSDVIMVSKDTTNNISANASTLLYSYSLVTPYAGSGPDYAWICGKSFEDCENAAEANAKRKNWTRMAGVFDQNSRTYKEFEVDHCLSKTTNQRCTLKISMYILTTVILCNLVKCVAMFWVLWSQREITLITSGDAISSWLEDSDHATAGYCIQSSLDLTHKSESSLCQKPRISRKQTSRWRNAVSKRRWIMTITILSATLVTSIGCFAGATAQMKRDTADSIISLGFGTADPRMLLSIASVTPGLVLSVLFANLPQLLLSLVYFSLNAVFTAMHLAHEYSGYQVQRKPLRVTTPRGQQRKTYWLQLPFVYSIPLIALSATLHWLISQAIFLVQFDIYRNGEQYRNPISSVGLSPAPMLTVVIIGICILAAVIGVGYWKLKGQSIPVAGSCSFALAAAAHRPEDDVDAAFLPVRWGEVVSMGNDELGHCCFTSQEVVDVVPGRRYAGAARKES